MSGEEAEEILRKKGCTCYLTRYSEDKLSHRLSVMTRGRSDSDYIFKHFNISVKTDASSFLGATYEIEGSDLEFHDIFGLLSFYQSTPVSHQVASIGECIRSNLQPFISSSPLFERKVLNSAELVRRFSIKDNSVPVLSPSISSEGKKKDCEKAIDLERYPSISDKSAAHSLSWSDEESGHEKMMRPSLSNLILIKWEDDQGQKQSLRISEKICAEWQTIGILLGQKLSALESYHHKAADDARCCRHVFHQWLENSSQSDYSPTWKGVYTLLNDIGHSKTAKQLQQALASKEIYF